MPQKKNRFIDSTKKLFRKIYPSPDPHRHSASSTSTQPNDTSFNLGAEPEVGPSRSSGFNAPVDRQLEVANTGSVNDSEGDHPNSLSQSPAQRERLQSDPANLGPRTNFDRPDRPQSPINMPVDVNTIGDTGNSARLDTALTVVKESLKVIARVGGAFPPLKAVAEGLGVVFDRIDASLPSSVPI
jgi:hypothetical protein